MKMIVCSVYDKAIEAYMRPFVCETDGQATRLFEDEVNAEGSPMGKHPEDYALFRIATFNNSSAEIAGVEPVCLARAYEVQRKVVEMPAVAGKGA